MRLSIAQAVGLVTDTAWTGRVKPAGFCPSVDPRLTASYCSRLHSPPPPRWQAEPDPFWGPPQGDPSYREALADHGLVDGAEFDRFGLPPKRNGFRGLTAQGRKRLQQGAALMEERRACCGFWTIALPDVALQRLMELDAWPVFQSSIRRRLAVALRTRGVPAQVVGVVELHPKRTASFATDLPHLHVLFRGKRHRWQQWAMAPAEFDRIVWWALWDACCWDVPQLVGCQVEPVRKSVRRYLAKYLGKLGRNSGTERVDNSDVRLIPRQWHFSSGEVIESIRTLTLPIPPEFLTFLIDRRKANGPGQLFHAHQVEIPDPRAPVIWRIAWRSPWALFLCWEAYEKALRWGPKPSL